MGNAELSRDLYLVTHVLRLGRMLYSESSKRGGTTERKEAPPTHMFRRPHAVAALNLSEMISPREGDTDEKEFTFKVSFYFFPLFFLLTPGSRANLIYISLFCYQNYTIN